MLTVAPCSAYASDAKLGTSTATQNLLDAKDASGHGSLIVGGTTQLSRDEALVSSEKLPLMMFDEGNRPKDEHNHPTVGAWDDKWFACSSSDYNHELATTASILASAAFNDDQTDPSRFAIDMDYDALGFENKVYKNYASEGKDSAAFSFATRKASVDGGAFPIVIAAIRGTSNDDEWLSNANIDNKGKSGADLHEGFATAADEVVDSLTQYLIDNNIDTADTRILVTGHSRGAAIANLVGYKLDKGDVDCIKKDNVFAYTFASPNTSTMEDVASDSYNNIFNIVNPEDIASRVPLAAWGFGKYGKTLYLPSRSNCSNYNDLRAAMQTIYSAYTNNDTFNSYAAGTWKPRVLTASMLAASPDVWSYYNLRHDPPTRIIQKPSATLYELIEAIWTVGAVRALAMAVGYPAYTNVITTFFAEEKIGLFSGLSGNQNIANVIKPEVFDAHRQGSYVAWMQSAPDTELFKGGYYCLSVAHPVDLKVYDESDTLVASIVDGKVDKSLLETGRAAYVDGSVEYVDIPKDANYKAVLTVTSSDAMDISWKELDAEGTTVAQTCYNDLSLPAGCSYSINLNSNGGYGTADTIAVTNSDGSPVNADYTADGSEAGSLSVEVTAEGNGDALGVSGATRGDQVTVRAMPYLGGSFKGWYENGTKVSSEANYSFRIEQARSLTAVFSGASIPAVAVTSVTASAAKTTLSIGESTTITAEALPSNAADKSMTYTSSDPATLTVSPSGEVTAKKAGTATVTVASVSNSEAKQEITFEVIGPSPAKTNVSDASITGLKAKTYTGKKLSQNPVVALNGKTLKAGTDYDVSYSNNVNVGTATIVVTSKGNYTGKKSATFKINKARQSIAAKSKSKSVKAKSLKKKSVTAKKLIIVEKAKGKVTYKNTSTSKTLKKFKVNSKNGAITIPKGTKKGTYELRVKIAAKGDANYKSGSKTVKVKIKVK